MKEAPCTICGGRDKKLIDGFYYCIECGTQDVNAQETVVEHKVLADNTFAHVKRRKLKVLNNAIKMSGEWHKWHTYNFIMMGLADEVVAAGGSQTFRKKVLWIWLKYMKKFVKKDEMGQASEDLETTKLFLQDDVEIDGNKENNKGEGLQSHKSIGRTTRLVFISIIYLALNYDRSEIQVSHLCRFIKEGKISLFFYRKHIPVEMDLKSIPGWANFKKYNNDYHANSIREVAMCLIKALDLEPPLVPDLKKLVDNYIKELCLPRDFKNLVLSLMKEIPCDHLQFTLETIRSKDKRKNYRIPDYEGTVMSYIMVALKMCFGLDDDYEIKLSNAIDSINIKESRMRSYKIGMASNPTDRLFSFREWINYLQLRKAILCKYYLPMAQHFNMVVDDQVFLGQLVDRTLKPNKPDLTEEVIMDLIGKISLNDDSPFIPRTQFYATVTPMTDYIGVILEYLQNTELKLLLSEDFTQYSLRHACIDLKLFTVNGEEVILTGITNDSKIINKNIITVMQSTEMDFSTVYVRNCDNKNWLKTNQPTSKHFIEIKGCDNNSDNENDSNLEYDSNVETINMDNTCVQIDDVTAKKCLETIDEETDGVCIFDDDFTNLDDDDKRDLDNKVYDSFDFNNIDGYNRESFHELNDTDNSDGETKFDPATFDRSNTIKKLIISACKTYKIPIPTEYKEREPKKRAKKIQDEAGSNRRKRIRVDKPTKYGDDKKKMTEILTAYYNNLDNDFFSKVSMQIQSFVSNFDENNRLFEAANSTKSFNVEENNEDYVNKNEKNVNNDETIFLSDSEVNRDKEQTIDDLLPKVDPRFDENTHDIKQLYVKFSKQFSYNDLLDDIYPEIEKIIEKPKSNKLETSKTDEDILCDFEDDLPLENIVKKLEVIRAKERQNELKLEYLVEDQADITCFKYWLRHYYGVSKYGSLVEQFNKELKDNFPKSFKSIIIECSSMLYVSPFQLYKYVQSLEKRIE